MKRRHFLQSVAISGAAATVAGELAAGDSTCEGGAPARGCEPAEPGAAWPLFEPLGAGSAVGLGWHLAALSDVRRGAMVLTLHHEGGRRAQVHLCRRGHTPRGIAHSAELDLVLMNDGDGEARTDESLGRVIKTLARLIAKNERSVPEGLLAHGQRLSAHGPRGILE